MFVGAGPSVVRWLLLLAALTSLGWTPYRTKTSLCSLRWYGQPAAGTGPAAVYSAPRTVPIQVDQAGLSNVNAAALRTQVGLALDAWNQVVCPDGAAPGQPLPTSLQLGDLGVPSAVGAACTATDTSGTCTKKTSNGNYVSVITKAADWPYGSGVFALTVLTYNTCSGEIVDGDILLDDASHQFCVTSCNAGTQHLRNTLTHEVGHLLGLDHSDLPQATMYYSAPSGEVQKLTLHGDDLQGICQTYANGCGPNHSCAAAASDGGGGDDSGCTAGPGTAGPSWTTAAAGVALIAALLRRRRRHRSEKVL